MSRYKLIGAIKDAAGLLGYTFYTGSDEAMASKIKSYPALWLSPPILKKMSGRSDCHCIYAIKITLMMSAKMSNNTGTEEVWSLLENDASTFRNYLIGHKSIRRLSDFSVVPNLKFYTKNGEVTLSAGCDVLISYHYKNRI